MYQQRQVIADCTVGPHHLGIADKWDGGDGDSDVATYDTAAGRIVLGGTQTRDDGTATFLCTEAFWLSWLDIDRNRGRADFPVTVVLKPVGDDGTPFAGGAATLTGIVKTVPVPKGDFSANDANAIALVFSLAPARA